MRRTLPLIGVFVLCGTGLGAGQTSASGGQVHSHADGPHAAASLQPVHYLTVNVEISDAGIQPSTVFVPAGQPVQLVLRRRGTSEHHYRVAGLVPDDLVWVAQGGAPGQPPGDDEEHNHHDRHFVRTRAVSPAGITPTGHEVHAYVSGAEGIDVVLFTAPSAGTFVVGCDLHPDTVGRLVVFEGAGKLAGLIAAPGNALSLARGDPLSLALSRDLGSVDYPGAPGVFVEATYAPAEYVRRVVGGPLDMAAMDPDRYVAVLLTEGVHGGSLPGRADPPDLYVGERQLPLIDWKVTTELPHHRATMYRFARDDAFGSDDQVMTLRLASGQEAVWRLSSSGASSWLILIGFAGALGFVGWLVWTTGFRPARAGQIG